MQKVLEWCLDLGVETMTVYAFSIDNFKRPQIEVDTLMDLVRTRFRQLLKDEYGVPIFLHDPLIVLYYNGGLYAYASWASSTCFPMMCKRFLRRQPGTAEIIRSTLVAMIQQH